MSKKLEEGYLGILPGGGGAPPCLASLIGLEGTAGIGCQSMGVVSGLRYKRNCGAGKSCHWKAVSRGGGAAFFPLRPLTLHLRMSTAGDMEAASLNWAGKTPRDDFPQVPCPSSAGETQAIGSPYPSPYSLLSSLPETPVQKHLKPAAREPEAPREKLCLTWERPLAAGAGLSNVGNSCYLNAALQCLTYTPPLANYLLSQQHSQACRAQRSCVLCAMQGHVSRALHQPGHVIHPSQALAAGFHRHKQEDAHEFLLFSLNAMQEACLVGNQQLDAQSQDSTFMRQIFGGYWRSQVECLFCHGLSDTLDPYLDIALDIKSAHSVAQALEQLVTPERLEGENAYHCSVCQKKTAASRALMLHTSPKVLILVLKRFSDFTGDKNAKEVRYPECLDMQPYMSEVNGTPSRYTLYAVLVHAGLSCHHGHYFAYIKAGNGQWYKMDDATVVACDLASVLHQRAYILFYVQKSESHRDSGTGASGREKTALGAEDTHIHAFPAESKRDSHIHGGNLQEHEEDRATGNITLDEWKFLQQQHRPKCEFNLRTVESALPSNAVLIHQSKHKGDIRTNHCGSEGDPQNQSDIPMGGKARATKRKNKQGKRSLALFSGSQCQG